MRAAKLGFKGSTGYLVSTLILKILEDKSLHGYGFQKELRARSNGEVILSELQIYPALKQLSEEGFVTSEWHLPKTGSSRKIFTITDEGRRELQVRQLEVIAYSNAVINILKDADESS